MYRHKGISLELGSVVLSLLQGAPNVHEHRTKGSNIMRIIS